MVIKRGRIKLIILLAILCIALLNNLVFAKEVMEISLSKDKIQINDEFEIDVKLNNSLVSSFTLQIYFDTMKLEYVNNIENSNFSENRVLYTWTNDNVNNEMQQISSKFTFKAIGEGNANIVVTGKFYNANGDSIEIDDANIQVEINSKNQLERPNVLADNYIEKKVEEAEQSEVIKDDNTNLKIMRVSEVGINPPFEKDIKQYYLTVESDIKNIDVTAIPENDGAQVQITGNNDLKQGLNTIRIDVTSKDRTKKDSYIINVTKTSNQELANADLENLQIQQGIIYPAFNANITNYEIEVANNIEKLTILAIPEKANSNVEIVGNNGLKEGENQIDITVTAEDGVTTKKYTIKAYRRNGEEEIQNEKEQEKQEEQLMTIIANIQEENNQNTKSANGENRNANQNNKIRLPQVIISTIVITTIIGGIIYILIKKRMFFLHFKP